MYCYKCFYMMQVMADKSGNAGIATCHYNRYLTGNYFVVKQDLTAAWNARQLQFQRQLVLSGNGGLCFEVDCSTNWHKRSGEKNICDACGYVPLAIEQKKIKLDYWPLIIEVYPSFACNNQCHFCFYAQHRLGAGQYALKPHFLEELKTVFFPKAEWIIINGGDPFCSKEGLGLMEHLVNSTLQKKIMVKTNGVLLESFGIDRLAAKGIELQITVFGMRAETYRAITGRDHFKAVMRVIDKFLLIGAGHLLELTFVVSDENAAEAQEFCSFVERHPQIKGIMWNEAFNGIKHMPEVLRLKEKYAHLSSRLLFYCLDYSLPRRLWRRRYSPVHWLRYQCFNGHVKSVA